jgi:RNA polymerase sigma-70 factor (ECF subfamily)
VNSAEAYPHRHLEDAELARLILGSAHGNARDAEAELYRRLAPRVRLYGLRHLKNDQAAQDLSHQVLLLTIEKLRAGQLREPEKIASFVLGTSRMVVRDWWRGAVRQEKLLQDYARDIPTMEEFATPEIDNNRLSHCLHRLLERERSVLVMTFYADKTTQEVAVQLGLSSENVRVIRHRALGRVRECMTDERSVT